MKKIDTTKMTVRAIQRSFLSVTFLLLYFVSFPQQLLVNPGMEDSTSWHIYNMGSAVPATATFNYTGQTPANGSGGCLRVTSNSKTNVLFWQTLTLKAGKSYTVNGAVKTGTVADFWCELYLSTTTPVENVDYSPNSNGDVIMGFSTWAGCGPNTDGTFAQDACTGKRIYTVPGTPGTDVTVYFGLKTGSSAASLPAPLQVLIDNLGVTLLQDSILLSTREGIIDTAQHIVKKVSPFITAEVFRGGLHAAPSATIDIVGATSGTSIPRQDTALISDTMAILVKGLNGSTRYTLQLRPVSEKAGIVHVSFGQVDRLRKKLWLPCNASVVQLKSAITTSPHATFRIIDSSGQAAALLARLSNKQKVIVTAENGDTSVYRIHTLPLRLPVQTLTNFTDTVSVIRNKIVNINGHTLITITSTADPLKGTLLNCTSDDIWLYFPNCKPSVVFNQYLAQITINGSTAVMDQNIRVEQYLQGTLVISQSAQYKALEVFSGEHLTGNSLKLGNYTYNRANELGNLHNAIRSFRLKKGYMATLAKDSLGTGYSRVYVADQQDIVIDSLPVGLYDDVSFVRVIPWRWVTKKGWTSGRDAAEALNVSWQYDWNNEATSGLNVEYIPMRHNRYWNSFDNINNKTKSTHALGFNEPERTDQANMTVNDAIALWPELLKSGLRLGAPAPSDGGLDWLFQFIDRCDALNYRVDFVPIHWYMGGQTPKQFYDRLKYIHDRTKRPIWITEWNNGANWTCCKPTYAQQADAIGKFLRMLDTASFVERYSLYEWVEDTRQMFYKAPTLLTPAGEVYRDHISPMAYNPANVYQPGYIVPPVPPVEYAGTGVGFDYGRSLSVDIDNDGDLDIVYSGTDPYVGGVLKNDGNGNFTISQSLPGLYTPSMQAGDVDGDGDLDIIFTGWDKANGWPAYTRLLRNNGTGTFTFETPPAVNAPCAGFADLDNNGLLDYFMIGNSNNNKFYFQRDTGFLAPVNRVSNGSNIQDPDASWADIDNDQDVDFCVEAYNRSNSRRYTQFWKNNGYGAFTEQAVVLKQKHWGSAQFADVDNDGDLDMLLNGDGDSFSDGGSSDIVRLYLNDGSGNYTEGTTFQTYRQNSNGKGNAFVDWDNDGDYDIIITGWSSSRNKEVADIYLNNGTGSFTRSAESDGLTGINRSSIELGDFNKDGRIDLLLNGYAGSPYGRTVAFLYKNKSLNVNTPPLSPAGLTAVTAGDSVQLSWSAGTDAESAAGLLTYNLYVKNAAGRYYIFPNANVTTGQRMIAGLGNAYHNTGWKLHGLPAGTYTWSVQTIDAGYAGSAFATEGSFTIGSDSAARHAAPVMAVKEATLEAGNAQGILLYPNPVTDRLTIQYGKAWEGGATITLLDVTGRIVLTKPVSGVQTTVDMSQLGTGTYFIRVNKAGMLFTGKIMKQ